MTQATQDNQKFYVYALIDPRDQCIKYIGKTFDLKTRFRKHILPSGLYNDTSKNKWIKELIALDLVPEIQAISAYNSEKEAYTEEQRLIKLYKDQLTNSTIGGCGGVFGKVGSFSGVYIIDPFSQQGKAVCDQYIDGYTIEELAKKYDCSAAPIRKCLLDNNIPRRSQKEIWENYDESVQKDLIARSQDRPKYIFSDERKEQIKQQHIGMKYSDETKKKQSEMRKGKHHKVSIEQIKEICDLYLTGKYSCPSLGKRYNITGVQVNNILNIYLGSNRSVYYFGRNKKSL